MIARIEDPDDPLAGFIAARTDRFSRNVAEGAAVAEHLKRAGRNFILVDVPVDLSTPESELMFTQMLAYAQYQLRYLQAGWWRSKKRAIGRAPTSAAPPAGSGPAPAVARGGRRSADGATSGTGGNRSASPTLPGQLRWRSPDSVATDCYASD